MKKTTLILPLAAMAALLSGCAGETSSSGGGGGGGGGAATGFIAYTLGSTPATQDVYVQNAETGAFAVQSRDISGIDPAMNLGGTKVVYGSTVEADQEIHIQTVNNDPSRIKLTDNTVDDMMPTFAPSGEVFFVRAHSATQWDIWRVNQTGSLQIRVTDINTKKISPAVSRDGLFVAYWELSGGTYRLVTRKLSDGTQTVAVSGVAVTDPLPSVSWYDSTRLLASSATAGVQKIYVINTDGTGRTEITDGFRPKRSRGGERILFGRLVGGGIQAFTCQPDGSGVTQYTVAAGQVSSSWDWSKD